MLLRDALNFAYELSPARRFLLLLSPGVLLIGLAYFGARWLGRALRKDGEFRG
jgi:hypothetical protein